MASVEKQHIEITPGICGGKPRIAGHRVRVQDIVIWTEQGQSPDEIVSHIPSITIADVYSALAYYHDHRVEVDGDIQAEIAFVASLKSKVGPGRLDLLRGTDAGADSVSP